MQYYYVNKNGYYFDVTAVKELFETLTEEECLTKAYALTGSSPEFEPMSIEDAVVVTATTLQWPYWSEPDTVEGSIVDAVEEWEA